MTIAVRQSAQARKDVIGYYHHIGLRDPEAADRFLNAFAFAAAADDDRIRQQPDIGSTRLWSDPALHGIRAWPLPGFKSFILYYRHRTTGIIRIMRVLRASVPPEGILRTPE